MTDKIKQIGRDECKMIRELVNMALEDALSDLGLKASIGNMTFDYETVSSKLTIAIEEYDAGKSDFMKGCWKFDLNKSDFGRKFESNGEVFTICGLKPRSRKYPILGKRADGKVFKFPANRVRMLLANQ